MPRGDLHSSSGNLKGDLHPSSGNLIGVLSNIIKFGESAEIDDIIILDLAEYEALPQADRENTRIVYFIKG